MIAIESYYGKYPCIVWNREPGLYYGMCPSFPNLRTEDMEDPILALSLIQQAVRVALEEAATPPKPQRHFILHVGESLYDWTLHVSGDLVECVAGFASNFDIPSADAGTTLVEIFSGKSERERQRYEENRTRLVPFKKWLTVIPRDI